MSYTGEVRNGVIVLENGAQLPEGMRVRIEPVETATDESAADEAAKTLGQRLLKYSGILNDLPADMARNHDHYLHGHPKK